MPRCLQYTSGANPKLFSFICNLISPNRSSPNAERSAFGRQVHVEDRGQKQSWSAEHTKGEKVAKTASHKIYSDVALAGKKESFLS